MNDYNKDIVGLAFLTGLIIGLLAGVLAEWRITTKIWEKQAIQAGTAEYNSVTAEFQWKTNK